MDNLKDLIVFQDKVIRSVLHNGEIHFVIRDVVEALTESKDPAQYIKRLRKRDTELAKGWVQFVPLLEVQTKGGIQKMGCANTKGIFRLIQSIPSPKAEPFKQWLAKVGHERIQENENPELVLERLKETYRLKGYNDNWINTRLESIGVRKKLTDEWQKRGVKKGLEYAILTSEISQAVFGLKPSEHKQFKALKQKHQLRDHMTETELLFTRLGEITTRNEAKKTDAQGLHQNKTAAKKGGKAANKALEAYEKETGEKVLSDKNFIKQIEDAKTKKKLK